MGNLDNIHSNFRMENAHDNGSLLLSQLELVKVNIIRWRSLGNWMSGLKGEHNL